MVEQASPVPVQTSPKSTLPSMSAATVDLGAIFRKQVEQVMTDKPAEKSQELKIVTPEGDVITAGELRDGVTWVPLRAIAQHFGATLSPDTKHGKVTIVKPA